MIGPGTDVPVIGCQVSIDSVIADTEGQDNLPGISGSITAKSIEIREGISDSAAEELVYGELQEGQRVESR